MTGNNLKVLFESLTRDPSTNLFMEVTPLQQINWPLAYGLLRLQGNHLLQCDPPTENSLKLIEMVGEEASAQSQKENRIHFRIAGREKSDIQTLLEKDTSSLTRVMVVQEDIEDTETSMGTIFKVDSGGLVRFEYSVDKTTKKIGWVGENSPPKDIIAYAEFVRDNRKKMMEGNQTHSEGHPNPRLP